MDLIDEVETQLAQSHAELSITPCEDFLELQSVETTCRQHNPIKSLELPRHS